MNAIRSLYLVSLQPVEILFQNVYLLFISGHLTYTAEHIYNYYCETNFQYTPSIKASI